MHDEEVRNLNYSRYFKIFHGIQKFTIFCILSFLGLPKEGPLMNTKIGYS